MSNFNLFYELDQIIGPALNLASNIHIGNANTTTFLRVFKPKLDLHENTKQNLVTATLELPGIKKENVELNVLNNILTISAESKISLKLEENGYTIHERRYGRLSRTLPLPEGTKETDIEASMEDGILTITFPKSSSEQGQKRAINIA